MRARFAALAKPAVAVSATVLSLALAAAPAAASPSPSPSAQHQAVTPVKHFIFLMQGGRSFDNYFGTYPGADGLSAGTCQLRDTGKPADGCVKPFLLRGGHLPSLGANSTIIANQYNGGKMDGFVAAYQRQGRDGATAMGHYDGRTLAFYWKVARDYVLFDHFFSSNQYGIRNNRSYWVSAVPAPGGTGRIPSGGYGNQLTIFDRLQAAGVSWKFYVQDYNRTQTYQSASPANPETQTSRVPLVDFYRFTHDPALAGHIVGLDQYYKDLQAGTLPAVAYVASSSGYDERSARSISLGQGLVRTMITQLMLSRYWGSSAFMWSYDGPGGWYDGVRPPAMGSATVGFRVPALLVSAYARPGPDQPHRPGLHRRAEVHRAELAARPTGRSRRPVEQPHQRFRLRGRPASACPAACRCRPRPLARHASAVSSPANRGVPAVRGSRRGQRPAAGLRCFVVRPFGTPAAPRAR